VSKLAKTLGVAPLPLLGGHLHPRIEATFLQ
jgi:hypothetical protein